MRTKLVKRHYCDHCGKGRFHKSAMTRHELACIYNSKRVCPLCAFVDIEQVAMEKLIAVIDYTDFAPMRKICSGCPACMLATIVQSKLGADLDSDDKWIAFDYKKELAAWYQSLQSDRDGNPMVPAF